MKIWDLSTRLYHWVQMILFAALLVTGFTGSGPHIPFGLAILTLVIWRLIWGIVGSETSRFKQFLRSPIYVLRYISGKETVAPGHNPAGGWMVITIVFTLFIQCLCGLAVAGFLDSWPYAEILLNDEVVALLENIHSLFAKALLGLVGLHVLAILFYKFRSKPLTWTMVTGKSIHVIPTETLMFVSQWRALIVLAVSTSVTIAIVVFS